jgi:GT2 family glycosyltransferase
MIAANNDKRTLIVTIATEPMDSPPEACQLSLVMPTTDWGEVFRRCFDRATAGLAEGDQALVVLDGEPRPVPDWVSAAGVQTLSTGRRSGPAAARNLGAQRARGSILVFVDADVELHGDTLERIRARLQNDPSLAAVFGSYDDRPAAAGLVSRYRNLLHHHTHQSHAGPASTFWAGCGAVRRETFLALGGFDAAAYRQPCIEDIEFGLRLHDSGGRILLDPKIQATHHKRWTLASMLRTDIHQRAIPWSRLLRQRRQRSTTLNLNASARASALLSLVLVGALALRMLRPTLGPSLGPISALCLVMILGINHSFYALCLRQGGIGLALAAVPLHILYFLTSLASFLLVMIQP